MHAPNQTSQLIQHRHILDSFLIANEVIHSCKRQKKGCFLLKVDFEKAFDFVGWFFLDSVMERMHFGEKYGENGLWNVLSTLELQLL